MRTLNYILLCYGIIATSYLIGIKSSYESKLKTREHLIFQYQEMLADTDNKYNGLNEAYQELAKELKTGTDNVVLGHYTIDGKEVIDDMPVDRQFKKK